MAMEEDLLASRTVLSQKLISAKRTRQQNEACTGRAPKRHRCGHCEQELCLKTYRKHHRLYYNAGTREWIKADSVGESSSSASHFSKSLVALLVQDEA